MDAQRELDVLRDAVEEKMGGDATLVRTVPVTLEAKAEEVTTLDVHEFQLEGAEVAKAYAWFQRFDAERDRRAVVVPQAEDARDARSAARSFLAHYAKDRDERPITERKADPD